MRSAEAEARAALEKHPYSKLLKRHADAKEALERCRAAAREASDWAERDRRPLGSVFDRRRIHSHAR